MSQTIIVRRTEPEDFAAVQAIYAAPRAQAGTLQLPFPSFDLWSKRLQAVDPNSHPLLACVDGEVVGSARPCSRSLGPETTGRGAV